METASTFQKNKQMNIRNLFYGILSSLYSQLNNKEEVLSFVKKRSGPHV